MSKPEDSAFPMLQTMGVGGIFQGGTGLTKRELIAAMAMQALINSDHQSHHCEQVAAENDQIWWEGYSEYAIKLADSLLAELSKEAE